MIDGIGGTLLEALANTYSYGTVVTISLRSSGSSFLATRQLITLARLQLAINQFLESATIMARHLEKYLSCQQTGLLVVTAFRANRTNRHLSFYWPPG
jgi:hypothetical protein